MKKEKIMKKKNMGVYIDGENISPKKYLVIFAFISRIGELHEAKVYARQKDVRTRNWSVLAKGNEKLKDIRLSGPPAKDKVDKKIQRDIDRDMNVCKNLDIIVIATSDHGYVSIVCKARKLGKRVIILGNGDTSKKLKQECSCFVDLDNDYIVI